MCDPLTVAIGSSLGMGATTSAVAGLGLATGAATVIGQKQQADAQYAYQEQGIVSNKEVAMQQMADVRQREAEESEGISRKEWEATIEGRRARSTAVVAAGDSGAEGQSVNALLSDLAMQEGRYKEALGRQKDFISTGADLNVESIKTGTANTNLRAAAPVAQPNYLAEALRVGADTYAFANR